MEDKIQAQIDNNAQQISDITSRLTECLIDIDTHKIMLETLIEEKQKLEITLEDTYEHKNKLFEWKKIVTVYNYNKHKEDCNKYLSSYLDNECKKCDCCKRMRLTPPLSTNSENMDIDPPPCNCICHEISK